jgi:hypothetical protein
VGQHGEDGDGEVKVATVGSGAEVGEELVALIFGEW